MALKIYGVPRSRTFRALWAAEELGIPYENVPVDFTEGVRKADFLAINPVGQIPAIDDSGFHLSESLAITTYLVKKAGGSLAPKTPEDDARTLQWTLWGVTSLEQHVVDFIWNRYAAPAEKRNEGVASAAESRLPRPLATLDERLAGTPYLLGPEFTLADLNVASVLFGAWFWKADLSKWPHVKAWLDRCFSRPGAQRARKLRD